MEPKHLTVLAGEPSGDLHGGHLLQRLREKHPHLQLSGVGGKHMQEKGLNSLIPLEELSVMGFSDVFCAFPRLYRHFHTIAKHIMETNPDGVVMIDYPGMHLRLAKHLRRKGYQGKLIHYICPSVWAWGKKRIQTLQNNHDLLLTILPFEKELFAQSSLKVDYIGNPLQEYQTNHVYQEKWQQTLQIPNHQPLLALFPGSRQGEIERNLHVALEAITQLQERGLSFILAVSVADVKLQPTILKSLQNTHWKIDQNVFLVPSNYRYELMRDSTLALAKSGTVTLELALHRCPTVVIYQVSRLNAFLAKRVFNINLPHYCLANILAQSRIFPEWVAVKLSPTAIAQSLYDLFHEGRHSCIAACQNLKQILGTRQASQEAAATILNEWSAQ